MEKNLAVRYAEAVDQIDAHRQTIAALNEKIVEFESALSGAIGQKDDLEEENKRLKEENEELKKKIKQLEDDADEKDEEVKSSAAKISELTGKLAMSPAHIDVAGRPALKDEAEGRDTMTYEQAQSEYSKITDPKARAEYRVAHAKELRLK